MPKLKTERDPWERWKGMVLAAKERLRERLGEAQDEST